MRKSERFIATPVDLRHRGHGSVALGGALSISFTTIAKAWLFWPPAKTGGGRQLNRPGDFSFC
jgi:hypothetical protein